MMDLDNPDSLPVNKLLPEVLSAISQSGCAVIQAPPGAGKTTLVPLAILQNVSGKVILVEPRRLAAKAAASRIAKLSNTQLGQEIGFHVRFDSQGSKNTKLWVYTPGVLLNQLSNNPELPGVSAIIIDEFHERSIETDLIMGLANLIRSTLRPDLKILVMSATLDAKAVSKYLDNCPVFHSEGRNFPVELHYFPKPFQKALSAAIEEVISKVMARTQGDILIFLPGMKEIRRAQAALSGISAECEIHILHGELSLIDQEKAICKSVKRKIILSTNVAESSVTVQGVTAVIDAGFVKQNRLDAKRGFNYLEMIPISKASADQRMGRAGRLESGQCWRLWSESEHRNRPDYDLPEIARVDLSEAVLRLHSLGETNLEDFPWFEKPPIESLTQAKKILGLLGAVDKGHVTPVGKRMANFPVHPRLGRILIAGAEFGCLNEIALACALLSEKTPFIRTLEKSPRLKNLPSASDLLDQVNIMQGYFAQKKLPVSGQLEVIKERAFYLNKIHEQLMRLFSQTNNLENTAFSTEGFLKALLLGFPDRVAKRRGPGDPKGVMVGGRGIKLLPASSVQKTNFFICLEVEAGTTESMVWLASGIEKEWLDPKWLTTTREIYLDEKSGKVVAQVCERYLDLKIDARPSHLSTEDNVAGLLFQKAVEKIEDYLPPWDSPGGQFIQRIQFLAEKCPEMAMPKVDDKLLNEVFKVICNQVKSLGEIPDGDWEGAFSRALGSEQLQQLNREAPRCFVFPNGKKVEITYQKNGRPEISARIQEFFGLKRTPCLARGKVPLLLKLLAPNFRPQQVTDDLEGFWKNSYHRVRKDLRGRYPKHSWPEDPLTAEVERKRPDGKKQPRP